MPLIDIIYVENSLLLQPIVVIEFTVAFLHVVFTWTKATHHFQQKAFQIMKWYKKSIGWDLRMSVKAKSK